MQRFPESSDVLNVILSNACARALPQSGTVNMNVQTAKRGTGTISGLGSLHLLGLMHGHWEVPASFSSVEQAEAVNMGVSIVVPAKKILEVLDNPELVAMRKEHYEANKTPNLPTQDSAFDHSPKKTLKPR